MLTIDTATEDTSERLVSTLISELFMILMFPPTSAIWVDTMPMERTVPRKPSTLMISPT